ncbi:hypothetical protein HMPREF9553_03476, partial [Escherichia coli MS 200-1]
KKKKKKKNPPPVGGALFYAMYLAIFFVTFPSFAFLSGPLSISAIA